MALHLRYTLGLLTLLAVVLLWVASNFLTNYTAVDQKYYKPFLTTYLQTASFALYLIPACLKWAWLRMAARRGRHQYALFQYWQSTGYQPIDTKIGGYDVDVESVSSMHVNSPALLNRNDSVSHEPIHDHDMPIHLFDSHAIVIAPRQLVLSCEPSLLTMEDADNHNNMEPLSARETAWLSSNFCFIWFAANYCNNASLGLTTVASTTILSSLSGAFTLVLAACVGADHFTLLKLVSVLISIAGVSLVAYGDTTPTTSDGSGPIHPLPPVNTPLPTTPTAFMLFGDFLSLAGAIFYAIYITFLKLRIRHEARLDMALFFGFVGVFNIITLIPIIALLHFTSAELFVIPTNEILLTLALNALLGTFLSDYLWLLSLLMTSPVVVTLGLSLTIPLALLGDFLFKHITVSALYLMGAIFIILGFVGVNLQLTCVDRWDGLVQGLITRRRRRQQQPPQLSSSSSSSPLLQTE